MRESPPYSYRLSTAAYNPPGVVDVCVCAVSTALNFYSGRNISCGIGERERGKRDGLETGRSVGKREREKIHSKSIAEPRHRERERETGEKHTAPSPPCVRLAVSAFQSRSRAASRRAALNHALSSHLLPPFDFFVFFFREELLICVLKHISCLIFPKRELAAAARMRESGRDYVQRQIPTHHHVAVMRVWSPFSRQL
jgi:hypothetical protein